MQTRFERYLPFGMLLLVALSACGASKPDKYQFHVRDGRLLRGAWPFTLNAIETPGLAGPGVTLGDVAVKLNRASEVGADSVCFELQGFSEDGASFSREAQRTVRMTMDQVTWRRMGALCRVFAKDAPQGRAYRRRAVKAAAPALKRENRAVYWIDGPDCAALAAAFKEVAPDLVVAAEEGGDVTVVSALPENPDGGPYLVVGEMPPGELREIYSYVMPGTDEAYAAFDKAMADPAELQPWTPDNSVLTEAEHAEGWISLFDGKSLDGWWIQGSNKKGFQVKDGAIEWARHGGSMLMTRDRYDNFVLRLEWRIVKGGNSGISLRIPRANRASKIGMEFQLQGDYGQEPEKHITGAIYDVAAPRVNASKPPLEWNEVEITLDGPKLKAVLNGQVVQDRNLDEDDELRYRLRRGFIGLQDHGRYVAFRNIRIKAL